MKLFLKFSSVCVCALQYMEEFAELLVPDTDPRHQVVERVVQHLAQRNKDIPEVSDVTWSTHVVQSPEINAFVLPVSKRKAQMSYYHVIAFLKSCDDFFVHIRTSMWLRLGFYFPLCRTGKCSFLRGCWKRWQMFTSSPSSWDTRWLMLYWDTL